MEPTEESAQTIEAFAQYGVTGIPEMLAETGRRVRQIVPEIWGMSVSLSDGDLTFTVVASSAGTAILDGVQYAAGGPCVAAIEDQHEVSIPDIDGPMVEEEWRLFASASAAAGVRSTLSFPLNMGGEVIGGVNLYASTEGAFAGHQEELADVFGTWANLAVSNADMGFASRARAEQGPARAAAQSEIDMAVGVLMGQRRLDPEAARAELEAAARKAGVEQIELARSILGGLVQRRDDGS
jgi:GAF domain-containing protein